MKLTLVQLGEEYTRWTKAYGNGRSVSGLRFGQNLWNVYYEDMLQLFPQEERFNGKPDGFYIESPTEAYNLIVNKITELMLKNGDVQ